MTIDEITTIHLDTFPTKDVKENYVNGELTVIWRNWDNIIKNPEMKAVLTFPDNGDSPFGDEWHVFVFYSKKFSGILTSNCPEGHLEWVPKYEITKLPTWEGDHIFNSKILKPGFFSAKFVYSGKILIDHSIF